MRCQHDLPVKLTEFAMAELNGEFYVLGGESSMNTFTGGPLSTVFSCGPSTGGHWMQRAPMKFFRLNIVAVALNNKEILVMGSNAGIHTEIYNVDSGRSHRGAKLKRHMYMNHNAVVQTSDGKIITTGGVNAFLDTTKNEIQDKWTELPALQTPRYYHTSVLVDDKYVVAMGGWNGNELLSSVEILNLDKPSLGWMYSTNLTSRLEKFGALVIGQHIVTVGGNDGESKQGTVSYVNATSLVHGTAAPWTKLSNGISVPRTDHGLVLGLDGASLLVIGGWVALEHGSSSATPSVEHFALPAELLNEGAGWREETGWHPFWYAVLILFLSRYFLSLGR